MTVDVCRVGHARSVAVLVQGIWKRSVTTYVRSADGGLPVRSAEQPVQEPAFSRTSTMNDDEEPVLAVNVTLCEAKIYLSKNKHPMLSTTCKFSIDLTTLMDVIVRLSEQHGKTKELSRHTRTREKEEKKQIDRKSKSIHEAATLQWHGVRSHRVDIHKHSPIYNEGGELSYMVDAVMPIEGIIEKVSDEFAISRRSVDASACSTEAATKIAKIKGLVAAQYHVETLMACLLHHHRSQHRGKNESEYRGIALVDIEKEWQNCYGQPLAPTLAYCQYPGSHHATTGIQAVIKKIQGVCCKYFPLCKIESTGDGDTGIFFRISSKTNDDVPVGKNSRRKLQNKRIFRPEEQEDISTKDEIPEEHAEHQAEEHQAEEHQPLQEAGDPEMDSSSNSPWRKVEVDKGTTEIVNGRQVHDAVKKHFRIHSAQSLIIHRPDDPQDVMSSDSQDKKSPPTGLWVLVLKTGELRAELGYLCLCLENGGSDVAVWQGVGDLTDKTYATATGDADFRVANENGNGFIIRLIENGQCSASSSSAS